MADPRILLYDIETTHNIVAQFDPKDQYTPHQNILQERYIVTAAWMWLGEKTVHSVSVLDDLKLYRKEPHNDKHVVETLHKVLSEADVVVGHNSDQFDNKFVKTRALVHGLHPLPPFISIDTYKVAKSQFRFNANRLDYLGKLLGFGGKKHTPPGLWIDVLKGDERAIITMADYNKRDVTLLRDVFNVLRPHIPSHVNRELFGGTGCPRCGSKKTQKRGTHKAITKTYQRFQCMECGGWFRELKSETKSTSTRVL